MHRDTDNREAVRSTTLVALAIKPRNVSEVIREIHPCAGPDVPIVSVLADLTMDTIAQALGANSL